MRRSHGLLPAVIQGLRAARLARCLQNAYFARMNVALDDGLAEGAGFCPVAGDRRDRVTRGAQRGGVGLAGTCDLFGGFVEDVEIVTEARGVRRGIQHNAPGKVAELIPVSGNGLQNLALKVRYRHDCNPCASHHSLCPPFFRSPAMTNGMSSSVISIAGSDDQKQSA